MPAPKTTQQIQAEVDQVVDIMHENIRGVTERGQTLDELNLRTVNLEESSANFSHSSKEIRKREFWRDRRTWLWLSVLIFILAAVGIGVAVWVSGIKNNNTVGGGKKPI
jgi:vesicle-associated membrane protein 4